MVVDTRKMRIGGAGCSNYGDKIAFGCAVTIVVVAIIHRVSKWLGGRLGGCGVTSTHSGVSLVAVKKDRPRCDVSAGKRNSSVVYA